MKISWKWTRNRVIIAICIIALIAIYLLLHPEITQRIIALLEFGFCVGIALLLVVMFILSLTFDPVRKKRKYIIIEEDENDDERFMHPTRKPNLERYIPKWER